MGCHKNNQFSNLGLCPWPALANGESRVPCGVCCTSFGICNVPDYVSVRTEIFCRIIIHSNRYLV